MIDRADPRRLHSLSDSARNAPIETALRRRVIIGFIVAVLLTSFIAFLSWRTRQLASDESDLVTHTYVVMRTLEATIEHAVDAETGTRGFVLTGDDSFLEPYDSGRPAIGRDLDALRPLIADNPRQQRRLGILRSQVGAAAEIERHGGGASGRPHRC